LAKQDPAAQKKFDALLKMCLSAAKEEEPPPRDPVAQLIVGFLQWNATRAQAEDAFVAMMDAYIDTNDLRVSHPHELASFLGDDYPLTTERILRLREALLDVYTREHDIHMNSIAGKGKKEQRNYLDTLDGTPPYVAALVTLLSFGGHAMPVDDKLCSLLIAEGCLDPGTTPQEAESYLQRQIKAGDAMAAHCAMQEWADQQDDPGEAATSAKPSTKPTKKSKSSKKKTTRKKK
jgi:endonuclease III